MKSVVVSILFSVLADIEQSIRFVGMGDTIEIWKNEEEGETFMEQEEFSKALQEVMSFNNED